MIKFVKGKIDRSWDKFIVAAEQQLKEANAAEEKLKQLVLRRHGLEVVIAQFKASRDAGEPWPGNIEVPGTVIESISA
jgi:hypothetical protein